MTEVFCILEETEQRETPQKSSAGRLRIMPDQEDNTKTEL